MANPKRASMREGPLAALFRKTEDDEQAPVAPGSLQDAREEESASTLGGTPPVAHPRETGLPHPALRATPAQPSEPTPVA